MMDHVFTVRPMLDMLSKGHLMRNVMGRFVQVLGLLVGFALLLTWIDIWGLFGTFNTLNAIGLIVAQAIMLFAFFKVVQVMLARGEDIRNLPESDFTMMSIFARLVRLPGELAFVFYALFSIPAMILTWAGAANLYAMFMFNPPIATGNVVIAGFAAFVMCWLVGFAALVTFSLAAELVTTLFSIAHDLRCTRRSLEGDAKPHTMPSREVHSMAA